MSTRAPGEIGIPEAGTPEINTAGADTIGKPDGPMKWVDELGMEVGTFTNPRTDLYKAKDPGKSSIMHHVPRNKRGYYKPHQVANYDPEEFEYVVDDKGFAMCTATAKSGSPCGLRAMHMSWLCSTHGGKLHPLDKIVSDERAAMAGKSTSQYLDPEVVGRMTRWQLLLHKIITVEDLDDEELARGQCRQADGTFASQPPKNIPKFLHDEMTKRLFERANAAMRGNLMGAVDALGEIARGDAFEPADRIKAAQLIIERVLGKNPDVVVHKQDAPWELALRAITGGSRAESRIARGLDPETGQVRADVDSTGPFVGLPRGLPPMETVEGSVDDSSGEWSDDGVANGEPVEDRQGDFVDAEVVGYADGDSDDRRRLGLDNPDSVESQGSGKSLADKAEATAEHIAATKELRDRLKKSRARREVTRSSGATSLPEQNAPSVKVVSEAQEDGTFMVGFEVP